MRRCFRSPYLVLIRPNQMAGWPLLWWRLFQVTLFGIHQVPKRASGHLFWYTPSQTRWPPNGRVASPMVAPVSGHLIWCEHRSVQISSRDAPFEASLWFGWWLRTGLHSVARLVFPGPLSLMAADFPAHLPPALLVTVSERRDWRRGLDVHCDATSSRQANHDS